MTKALACPQIVGLWPRALCWVKGNREFVEAMAERYWDPMSCECVPALGHVCSYCEGDWERDIDMPAESLEMVGMMTEARETEIARRSRLLRDWVEVMARPKPAWEMVAPHITDRKARTQLWCSADKEFTGLLAARYSEPGDDGWEWECRVPHAKEQIG